MLTGYGVERPCLRRGDEDVNVRLARLRLGRRWTSVAVDEDVNVRVSKAQARAKVDLVAVDRLPHGLVHAA